jgi:hypothetical protein
MSENTPPPVENANLDGFTEKEVRLAQLITNAVCTGMVAAYHQLLNGGHPIEVQDDKGRKTQQLATIPQLMQNLADALDDNTDVMEINNELAQDALEEAVDEPPRRKRRK